MKKLIVRSARLLNRTVSYKGPKVAFIHIPKCGGSSLKNALYRKLDPFSRYKFKYDQAHDAARLTNNKTLLDSGITDDFEQLKFLLCYHLNGDHRFLHGHFPVTADILEHYKSEFHFVTLLRDPVDRWKSNYLFNKGLPDPDSIKVPSKTYQGTIEDEFTEVVESGTGLLMGALTSSFLAGRYPADQNDALGLSKTAVSNLQLFSQIGTLDKLEKFTQQLSDLTGKKLSVRTDNKTRLLYFGENEEKYHLVQEFLDRDDINRTITSLTQADQLIFDTVKNVDTCP